MGWGRGSGTITPAQIIGVLDPSQIPNLSANKINADVLGVARIPDLDAAKITTSEFDVARIPNHSAAKVTSGVMAKARIDTTGAWVASEIPNLDAAKITTGVFDMARTPIRQRYGIMVSGAGITWTNQGAALSELSGNVSRRIRMKLDNGFTEWRLHIGVGIVGAAGAVLGMQFSNDGGTTWFGLDNGTSATQSTQTQSIAALGFFSTAWATIHANARIDDCLLRCTGSGGDGAADPQITEAILEVRLS